ncbi:MAG: GtrA family protein [Desulfuromonadales bacterium]|nr:GtrA family protein [Desulfuromonadales bacterium]
MKLSGFQQSRLTTVSRFGAVGVINTLIDFGVFNLLVWLFGVLAGPGLLACNAVAFVCANLNSYFCNKQWTFGDDKAVSVHQYTRFMLVSLGGLLINSLVLYLLVDLAVWPSRADSWLWVNFAKACATLFSLAWNFIMYRLLVFQVATRGNS